MSTEQITISQEAYDHLRVQISILKDDLHQAREENGKLEAKNIELRFKISMAKAAAMNNAEAMRYTISTISGLISLLGKASPIIRAHAGASHMLEGFQPRRNQWDELADAIQAVLDEHNRQEEAER